MIERGKANSEKESKEEGKSDGSIIMKISLKEGKIEEMSVSYEWKSLSVAKWSVNSI